MIDYIQTNVFLDILAGQGARRDTFSPGKGRLQTVIKMAVKGFLALAVVFLIFSLIPHEAESQEGPKVTDKVMCSMPSSLDSKRVWCIFL